MFESERLREFVCQMADDWGLEATFTKVKDIQDIVAYDLISTPTAVIDGWVKLPGSILARRPSESGSRQPRGGARLGARSTVVGGTTLRRRGMRPLVHRLRAAPRLEVSYEP